MNIVEIIKKVPKDHVYWNLMNGECSVVINEGECFPIKLIKECYSTIYLSEDGKFFRNTPDGECLLFPSKDNRDWAAFERELDGNKEQFYAYCHVGDMVEINLDHEFYQKVHPYIDFLIDGKKYSLLVSDIKELSLKDKENSGVDGRHFVPANENYSSSIVIPDTPDNHIEMVSIPDHPMMAAVICAGLLAGRCSESVDALAIKAVDYADMILDYTKEESNDKGAN